jgi:uncharacterized protein YukE
MRTVTTPAAQAAASQMGHELPGLQTTATNLIMRGHTLSNPNNWEGPKAQLFRSQIWPDVESALTTLQTNLRDLTNTVAEINRRTAEAGS